VAAAVVVVPAVAGNLPAFYNQSLYMKTMLLFTGILVSSLAAMSQSVKVLAGKKILVISSSKTNMTMSAMGQDVDMVSSNTSTSDYEIMAVTEKGYSLRTKVLRVEGSYVGGGAEKIFDTDKATDRYDPMLAGVVAMIGKPTELLIENRKASVVSGEVMNNPMLAQMGMKDNVSELLKFILYKTDLDKFTTGTKWVDSVRNNELLMLAESEVTGITETEIELSVKTTMDIHATIQQMGMEGKTTVKGLINSKRRYNRNTGLLIKEETSGTADGETEVMNQRIPMQMKIQSTVTVQ